MGNAAKLPLAGLRVLDMTRLLPGPLCAQHIADLGADVIKIEDTERGDYVMEPVKRAVNRNKRAIRLNLKSEEGVAIFMRLVATADAVLEGFRPGILHRLGVGYEAARAIRPGIVYCSITGYGQDGPMHLAGGHDLNYCALAGVTDMVANGTSPPSLPHFLIADLMGGTLTAAMGLLAALLDVQRGGPGRHVDVSITDAVLAHNILGFLDGQDPKRPRAPSTHSGANLRYRLYDTADGRHIAIGAQEKQFWDNACDVLGRPDLKPHHLARSVPGDPLTLDIEGVFRRRTQREWIEAFEGLDACVTPVLYPFEAAELPLFNQRGMVVRDALGQPSAFGFPVQMTDCVFGVRHPPPSPGQHSREILDELGIDAAEFEKLKLAGIV